MLNSVTNYFSEFKVLKSASKDFWLTNAIQFFDGLAYFSMITVLALYLTDNCGFNDVNSGVWVGIFTLYITAFVFAVGSICDTIGIKKSLYIGLGLLAVSRGILGFAPAYISSYGIKHTAESIFTRFGVTNPPEFFLASDLAWSVKAAIIIMALGTAFMGPVIMTSLRRFTSKDTRATGFNVYYLLMNIAAIIASAIVIDGFRRTFGPVQGNLAILDFGFVMSICAVVCASRIDEDNYAEESERVTNQDENRRPLAIFMEVWREKAFQKLLLFLTLTIGVRLVFTHQFLVMPKYYTRLLYSDFELGLANSINPTIIVIGLIILIPIINRYSTIKLIIVGMTISAASLILLAIPIDWVMSLPGINNLTQAYLFIIVTQILVFAIGELIFNPRFMEYIASVAPQDRVSSYMALSALPTFISKPINGFVSGILISRYCYDGVRPKIETGNISYTDSPEFMWMIYLLLAVLSPIAVIALRNFITSEPAAATEATEDETSKPDQKGADHE
ncbi:MFS transporter [Verrucomicrobiaceae bacterium N1E253]|uniref:MFS transporter n=1 Tax=Oceaniferula marina TaxID=2748318 RepID=A0A851GMZ9_9BACT|nr:MFS transporter [Oceaniferula marina]NWK56210.1 MFS transporter [Oceaniferula marina]